MVTASAERSGRGGSKRNPYGASRKIVSLGQKMLLERPERVGDIAASAGVSSGLVSRWRRGDRVPSLDVRRALEASFGIPAESWDLAPCASLPDAAPESAGRAPSSKQKAQAASAPEGAEVETAAAPRSALTGYVSKVDAQIRMLEELQGSGDLSTGELVRVADSITKLLTLKGNEEKRIAAMRSELEKEYEHLAVQEAPFIRRYTDRILEALRPHPEALRDVIESIGGGDAD